MSFFGGGGKTEIVPNSITLDYKNNTPFTQDVAAGEVVLAKWKCDLTSFPGFLYWLEYYEFAKIKIKCLDDNGGINEIAFTMSYSYDDAIYNHDAGFNEQNMAAGAEESVIELHPSDFFGFNPHTKNAGITEIFFKITLAVFDGTAKYQINEVLFNMIVTGLGDFAVTRLV